MAKRRDIVEETQAPIGMLDDKGREVLDNVPMAPPVGYKAEPSMIERIRSMVRSEHLRLAALQSGHETFEEADDFDVDDDFDPSSPFEEVFDPVDSEARNRLRQAEFRAEVEERLGKAQSLLDRSKTDASYKSDERRGSDSGERSGRSGEKRESKSSAVQDADDDGGVSKADRGSRAVKE